MTTDACISNARSLFTLLGLFTLVGCYDSETKPCANGVVCPSGAECTLAQDGCVVNGCGDGVVDTARGEVCDDGNLKNNDGCSADCSNNYTCGNKILDPGEICDHGDRNGTAKNCSRDCKSDGTCGNGVQDTSEDCDYCAAAGAAGVALGRGIVCLGHESVTCNGDCTWSRCGDNHVNAAAGETCDASNGVDTPKCNGRNAPAAVACREALCGDGYVNATAGEQCDDGNTIGSDGCSASCDKEECGNGTLDPGEACDEGQLNGELDRCSKDCKSTGKCGNGSLDLLTEECDYCSDYLKEPRESGACPVVESLTCTNRCTLSKCGDNYVNKAAGETCDASNGVDTKFCNGNTAPPVAACHDVKCGDGYTNSRAGEKCDDGNETSGDGCSDACQVEGCGNGVKDKGEECDDGKETVICTKDCKISACGDGYTNKALNANGMPVEVCDDGNQISGDNCSADCKSNETCGNGIKDEAKAEVCDEGKLNGQSGHCSKDCGSTGSCGNGFVDLQSGEQCDYCEGYTDGAGTVEDSGAWSDAGGEDSADSSSTGDAGAGKACPLTESSTCNDNCKISRCGDGKVNHAASEQCDIAGGADTRECNGNAAPAAVACHKAFCGDGWANSQAGEFCDSPYDSSTCNKSSAPEAVRCREAACGDGYTNLAAGERCDSETDLLDCNKSSAPLGVRCQQVKCGDGYVNGATELCDSPVDLQNCNGSGAPTGIGCQAAKCGDGYANSVSEVCDSPIDLPNCNASGAPAGIACQAVKCGDGYVNKAVEVCDSPTDLDTCNKSGAPAGIACQAVKCGDGYVNSASELCDSPTDLTTCNSSGAPTTGCQAVRCGDRYVNTASEACEDFFDSILCNRVGAPGDAGCHEPRCGDGYTNTRAGEQCDPPDSPGCDASCHQQNGFQCTIDASGKSTCGTACGDGVLAPGEACDDNHLNGNACGACNTGCALVEPSNAEYTMKLVGTRSCGGAHNDYCYSFGDAFTLSDGAHAPVTFEFQTADRYKVPIPIHDGRVAIRAFWNDNTSAEVMATNVADTIKGVGLGLELDVRVSGDTVTIQNLRYGALGNNQLSLAINSRLRVNGFSVAQPPDLPVGVGYDCGVGVACNSDTDCQSRTCDTNNHVCKTASCTDGIRNGDESDVDCGANCGNVLCDEGEQCISAPDCESSVCTSGKCAEPTCDDNVQNGNETGRDCGTVTCGLCSGSPCQQDNQCWNGHCDVASGATDGTCQ